MRVTGIVAVVVGLVLMFAGGCRSNYRSSESARWDSGLVYPQPRVVGGERYDGAAQPDTQSPAQAPLSTISLDVDTASYANVRRFLQDGQLPPAAAVRPEEMINYFAYDDPAPEQGERFAATMELGPCPWQPTSRILRVGLRAADVPAEACPPRNITFSIDTSGSMDSNDKLKLLKRNLNDLIDSLNDRDRVGIVTYAGSAKIALEPTSCRNRRDILKVIDRLRAGGSTAGAAGLERAYDLADRFYDAAAINRVIVLTDGDFNVGASRESDLIRLVESKRDLGIYLNVVGYGTGNLNDSMLEKIADHGQGSYFYIDSVQEGERRFRDGLNAALLPVARDVKVQVEFNPLVVRHYRMIGYANRQLQPEDFNDDRSDAVEVGAGQCVVVLYELEMIGAAWRRQGVDPLKYGGPAAVESVPDTSVDLNPAAEVLTLKLRYKAPGSDESELRTLVLRRSDEVVEDPSADYQWSVAVAAFAQALSHSTRLAGGTLLDIARRSARQSCAERPNKERREAMELMDLVASMTGWR